MNTVESAGGVDVTLTPTAVDKERYAPDVTDSACTLLGVQPQSSPPLSMLCTQESHSIRDSKQ